jgi:RimJ/RimL family protein N-acetyltransferase
MDIGPTLETARLILRPPNQSDFPAFAEMMSDADHVRFVGGEMTPSTAWRAWATLTGAWILRGFSMFSVIEKDTGQWLGRIGPWQPEGWPAREVGWGLTRMATGKGYGLEAATACMNYVFEDLKWDRVIHIIDPENLPSIALAQRLGSENLGRTQMPAPLDHLVVDAWGQTAEAWKARQA